MSTTLSTSSNRVLSIDHFRALTMFLMVFVNDFWSLKQVPEWLTHALASEDRLGFSDVIFPAFLFIVGLSIPYAISQRFKKSPDILPILGHIGTRTIALLIMGVFLVNLEYINRSGMDLIPVGIWQILLIVAFLAIWNHYPKDSKIATPLKIAGFVLLCILAATYKGGTPENPTWMKTHWWGILGLIGWAYLTGSVVYLLFRDKLAPLIIVWLALVAFNICNSYGAPVWLSKIRLFLLPIGNGSLASMTLAGIVTSVILRKNVLSKHKFSVLVAVIGLVCLIAGILLRPLGGISKIGSTPSWTLLSTGFSFLTFSLIYYFHHGRPEPQWTQWIKPAGTAALTCYLIPYVAYVFGDFTGIKLPPILVTGIVGLLKSFLFSAAVVWVTGLLIRRGIRLKI